MPLPCVLLSWYAFEISVLLVVLEHITSSIGAHLQMDNDYFYQEHEMEDAFSPNNDMQPETNKYVFSGVPNSVNSLAEPSPVVVAAVSPGAVAPPGPPDNGCGK